VVVGDAVTVEELSDGSVTIEEVFPRENELLRRAMTGRKAKVVAANVDRALVVVAARDPEPRRELIDRFLALVGTCGITPVLVVNKVDLPEAAEVAADLARFYGDLGFDVIPLSALGGEGVEAVRDLLSRGRSVFVGPSGVGKSSLLNALEPGLLLRTGAVSVRGGRGRHTTVGARLIHLPGGGEVVDTPGFSDATLWQIDPSELAGAFPELADRAPDCRFRGCSHTHEPGCAVREALARGEVDSGRYESYRRLLQESLDEKPL
jgi:ribosome biogenesis GTPase / thiamine phosphate phosphatase